MLIGYMRVSTEDQNLELQRDALSAAGCEKIFEDKASGVRDDRPGLAAALSHLRQGDVLVIWKLDRLGRRLVSLLELVQELHGRGVEFKILDGGFPIDTTSAQGRFMFAVVAALAEMERDLIRERTRAGLKAARARGRRGGRKPKLTAQQIDQAKKLLAMPATTIAEVAEAFNVNRATIYRSLGLGKFARAAAGPTAVPLDMAAGG